MATKKRTLAFTATLALAATALLFGVLGSPASSAPAAPQATLIVGGIQVLGTRQT